MKTYLKFFLIFAVCLLATGCADQVSFQQAEQMTEVGFLHGLWHGMIFPIAFICSLFSDNVAVYAIYNSGGWYDFGYMIGLGSSIGGTASSSSRK